MKVHKVSFIQIHRWFTHLFPRVGQAPTRLYRLPFFKVCFASRRVSLGAPNTQHPSCGWKQRSTRNGCRFHKRKEKQKHPPNLGKVKHIPPGKDRWRSPLPGFYHGPLLLATELGSDACAIYFHYGVAALLLFKPCWEDFLTTPKEIPVWYESNVSGLLSFTFHVSAFFNHCKNQCQHHQQKHRNQSYT